MKVVFATVAAVTSAVGGVETSTASQKNRLRRKNESTLANVAAQLLEGSKKFNGRARFYRSAKAAEAKAKAKQLTETPAQKTCDLHACSGRGSVGIGRLEQPCCS